MKQVGRRKLEKHSSEKSLLPPKDFVQIILKWNDNGSKAVASATEVGGWASGWWAVGGAGDRRCDTLHLRGKGNIYLEQQCYKCAFSNAFLALFCNTIILNKNIIKYKQFHYIATVQIKVCDLMLNML